jgi:hypothetical protein
MPVPRAQKRRVFKFPSATASWGFALLRKVKGGTMRTLARTAAALGFAGAMAIGTTVPVMAAGIYINGHGVHVHLGHHRHYYDRYAGGGWNTYNGCPPGYTIQGGNCAPYHYR